MADTAQATEEKTEQTQDDSKTQVQSAEFTEASGTENAGAASSLDILLDMNLPVMVAVGKKEVPIQQLLQLGPGSVLKLDKPIDEPADLYLKDVKFATGNIVVVDGSFAIKIKQILGFSDSAEKNAGA